MTTFKRPKANIDFNLIDKIIFVCKEADCSRNCILHMNVPSTHQHIFEGDKAGLPISCPFRCVTPIWKYEGKYLVKDKIDEIVTHG